TSRSSFSPRRQACFRPSLPVEYPSCSRRAGDRSQPPSMGRTAGRAMARRLPAPCSNAATAHQRRPDRLFAPTPPGGKMKPGARRPRWLRHGIAPLAVAAALLLRWVLWPLLGPDLPLLFYWPAVVFSAWYGGSRAGLLATLLSSAAVAYFLLDPRYT